jgi:hypothetical protein
MLRETRKSCRTPECWEKTGRTVELLKAERKPEEL